MKKLRSWLTTLLGIAIIAALIMWLNSGEALHLLSRADWALLVVAVICTTASYLCMSIAYEQINRIFNVAASTKSLLAIGFLSTALGEFMSMGGLSMHSARLVFLKKEGVPYADALAASLFNTYLNAVVLLSLAPFGLMRILREHKLGTSVETSLVTGTLLLSVILVALGFAMFKSSVRQTFIAAFKVWANKCGRLDGLEKFILSFDNTFDRGALQFRRHRKLVAWTITLMVADWLFAAAALWFCMDALAAPIDLGILLTGFCAGMALAFLSMIPGGLGVQEGTMTAIYVGFGVDPEQAVLAVLAFRLVYQTVPFVISLPLYKRLMSTWT